MLLTADELATRFKVSQRTVVKWVKNGQIPVIRPSPKIMRFDADAVAKALTVPAKTADTPAAKGDPHGTT